MKQSASITQVRCVLATDMFNLYFTCWQFTSSFDCNVGNCI